MNKNFNSILITGASSGIGAELAKQYASKNTILLLMGRNEKRLQEVASICSTKGSNVKTSKIDVTDKQQMQKQILEWDKKHSIDLVIANAGISHPKKAETQTEVESLLNININGVINTIYPLIPEMKSRKRGTIAIMSSLAGFRGMPTAVSYSTSKNAVRAMGDALRPELKKYNINTTVICPGFIKTPLTDINPFPMPFLMMPDKAAKTIISGIKKNKKRIAFPSVMYIIVLLMAYLPVSITDKLLASAAKKKR